jgi:hypothetical protein
MAMFYLVSINNCMQMYTVNDIRQFLCQYSPHVTHLAVGHTSFYTYEKSRRWIESRSDTARQQFRHFRNCFNQFLYCAKANRNPKMHAPLMLTALEGKDVTDEIGKTLHFHIALGNLPTVLTTDELRKVFTHCWVNEAKLSGKGIWFEEANKVMEADNRWLYYTTKEAKKGNEWAWDVDNTQIPTLALARRT